MEGLERFKCIRRKNVTYIKDLITKETYAVVSEKETHLVKIINPKRMTTLEMQSIFEYGKTTLNERAKYW